MFSIAYEELHRLASHARRGGPETTISSRGLVNEAWLKLHDSPQLASVSLAHFKAIAAKAMRRILIDRARQRNSRKRGGGNGMVFVPLDDAAQESAFHGDELIEVHRTIEELERANPRHARMAELRLFGGLSNGEIAEALDMSESTVARDWRAVKSLLAGRLRPGRAVVVD